MGAKINVTGVVKKIRRIKSPVHNIMMINCLEIETGGSVNPPKALPMASKKVNYTVLLNDKQFNKLNKEIEELGIDLKGSEVLAQGEITLDQPMNIVEGEIGVICFIVQPLEAVRKRIEEEKSQAAKEHKNDEIEGPSM